MATIFNNYVEETKPLFRLLRTEAFRFILVCFNHYALQTDFKADLQRRFPNRRFGGVDAAVSTYRELADAYYSLGEGFFFIDNFEAVLTDPEKYNGLNLHRDKLAQSLIAIVCFISPGAQALGAKNIMEKMPDLWSFRSFMLDLKMDITIASPADYSSTNSRENIEISTLGGYTADEKRQELERLQKQVHQTAREDKALREILLRQIKDIQSDIGLYTEAIRTIDILLNEYVSEAEDIAILYGQKGDLLVTIGRLHDAIQAFSVSLKLRLQTDKRNIIGVAYERLGAVYLELGNLLQAQVYYGKSNQLEKELYQNHPNSIKCKHSLAISYQNLGNIQFLLNNLSQALVYYEQYNQLEYELYQAYPNEVEFKDNLSISYQHIGNVQYSLNNLSQALTYYGHCNLLQNELNQAFPDNIRFQNGLAISCQYLGNVHSSLDNLQQALFYYVRYNQLLNELYQTYPDNVRFKYGLAISYCKLGEIESALDNLSQELTYYQQYNQLGRELYQAYPDNIKFKNSLAISLAKLGCFYQDIQNDTAKALSCFQQAEQLWTELVALTPNHAEYNNHLKQIRKDTAKMDFKRSEAQQSH